MVLCSVSAFFVLLLALLSYRFGWLCCVLRPPSGQKQTKTSYFKKNPYCVRCFLGILRYQKRQKQRYILLLGVVWLPVVALHLVRWWCTQGAGASGGVFRPFLPAFCPLYCFALVGSLANIALFRVFRGFSLLDVGLYCSGAWLVGFCVRERLGGFGACGVFASVFLLLLLCLPPFMLVVLLCSGCLSLFSCIVFVALWVLVVLLFPLRTIRKKKRAQFLASSLGVL